MSHNITSHLLLLVLHIIVDVMPTFFEALDAKTTQFNQKHVNVVVLNLIVHCLTVVSLSVVL